MAESAQQRVEVPVGLSLFGSLVTDASPSDLPEGLSPDNQDIIYLPGSVSSRPGLRRLYYAFNGFAGIGNNRSNVTYCKSFVLPTGNTVNLILDGNGNLWKEDVDINPGVLVNLGTVNAGSIAQSITAFGREYIAFSDGIKGIDIPLQFDGVNLDRVSQDGPGAGCGVADHADNTVFAPGLSPGIHQVVVIFQTRNGALTAPSPIKNWAAAGGKKISLTNIPIGPPNVIARVIAFTAAGGDNFFYLPVPPQVSGSVVGTSSVINDNVTTAATLDFSDNSLLAGIGIDIRGNNLFDQVVLGPCISFASYASRLLAWGELNKIQNLINMGFDGGYLPAAPDSPLGWTVENAGGQLVVGRFGSGWQITDDASTQTRGVVSQTAYQDAFGISILKPSTTYDVSVWLKQILPPVNLADGNLFVGFFQNGVLVSGAVFNINTMTPAGKFFVRTSSFTTPAIINNTAQIKVYFQGTTLLNCGVFIVDEISIIPQSNPFFGAARVSYVDNPEAFDGVTGVLGPEGDDSPLQCMAKIRDNLYMTTREGSHVTIDDGLNEPSKWKIREISHRVGALSIKATDYGKYTTGDSGEEWNVVASQGGLYIFAGGEFFKVSQEIQSLWDRINPRGYQYVWVKNDNISRRIYVGVPLDTAITPTVILVLDYRELTTATDIASRPPIHISFTGRMIASDLSRKWTKWSISAICAEFIRISPGGGFANFSTICFASGNGLNPGDVAAFSNLYRLDPTYLTDDDYGMIVPYYVTYFFINHEMEQALQVGQHRKLYKRFALNAEGTGFLRITPYADTLDNPLPHLADIPLFATQFSDFMDGMNIITDRCAFKLASIPGPNQTNNSFNIQKFIPTLMQEPVAPLSGGAV